MSKTQEHKIRFSLKNKLLFIFGLLIILSIFILTFSMIYLFKEDKKAYTYQKQSTETLLASKEFLSISQKSIGLLKQAIGLVQKDGKITLTSSNQIKNLLHNQETVIHLKLLLVDLAQLSISNESTFNHDTQLKLYSLQEKDLSLNPSLIQQNIENLKVNGFSFFNLSQPDRSPLLGVLIADSKNIQNNQMQIAFGITPLELFARDMKNISLSIATYQGVALFDSNPRVLFEEKNVQNNPLFKFAQEQKTASGSLEFSLENDPKLGTFIKPDLGLVVTTTERWDDVVKATYELIEKSILISAIIFSLMVILIVLFSRSLTLPLQELFLATQEVSRGNFQLKLQPKGSDEIAVLGKSFRLMSSKITDLIEKEKEKTKIESELEIASTVQKTLIPPSRYEDNQIKIESYYHPASQCGGDWWGYFSIQNKFYFLIADATGHGFPSALITASARSCLSVIQKMATENPEIELTPARLLSYANKSIFDSAQGQILMTFFVGIIDFKTNQLHYSSAGHNPPWLIHTKNENGKEIQVIQSLITDGIRLGETEHLEKFEEKSIPFQNGAHIFLYTDGLTEGKNSTGDMFGKKSVRNEIKKSLSSGEEFFIENLAKKFLEHNGTKPLDDDITLALLKIK